MTSQPKMARPMEVIRRRRMQLLTTRGYLSLALRILVITLAIWFTVVNMHTIDAEV